MNIKARFACSSVFPYCWDGSNKTSEIVYFHSVYSSDPDSPNYSYSQATPNASLQMTISNPDAFGAFKTGKEYDLMFTPTKES